ncbi:DNA-directed RNA polymerase I subunit rpa2 [Desmophyllum pertusum]|uniref:DNA-directed RNA polymerase I subunit rpa2 n=1 Tax=Desmophyllum pertusum TaxID=174260 RepID=A0A9X0CF25_9CNID|nr:DNA-directed RNA polymerase I subunit rpa2 [Desmophyllum pertusum]
MFDILHSHLAMSKQSEMAGMTTPMSHTTPGGRGFQGQMTTPGKMDQGFGGNTAAPNAGLTGIQHEIHRMITTSQHEEGMSFAQIKQKVKTSDQQIRNTLEFLSNEGHIYSTIDDDHYKSTDSY